ncbi:MAG TPA: ComF family protein [Lachnospiraceae bacterium]|nr:ComF family protein [Lachnospiraceae bacterium]
MQFGKVTSFALDLLYPRRCPICHEPAPAGKKICPACRKKLPYIETKRCRKCGKPVEDREIMCEDCKKTEHVYTAGIGVFRYDETMRGTISYYKFKGRREYGEVLGELTYEGSRNLIELWDPQLIIPIPLHSGKQRTRGYNQAAELARPVSRRSGIRLDEHALIRTEKTLAMKNLGAAERAANLSGAFIPGKGFRPVRSVLLIDDIYTTGTTVDSAAAALKECGVSDVFFVSLCIGGGFLSRY